MPKNGDKVRAVPIETVVEGKYEEASNGMIFIGQIALGSGGLLHNDWAFEVIKELPKTTGSLITYYYPDDVGWSKWYAFNTGESRWYLTGTGTFLTNDELVRKLDDEDWTWETIYEG